MKTIGIEALSSVYKVRRLVRADVEEVCKLCESNPQYYAYCEKEPSQELILQDMQITPPGVPMEQKYYVGFFNGTELVAVMDLIDGYPDDDCAFIGFFMLHGALQGAGLGSGIVAEVFACLRACGMRKCQLGIDKDNPQSNHFWGKNGFAVIREAAVGGGVILLAEKIL